MRLLDLELSVERQLRDLPDAAYLLAMSVIGKHLAGICDGFFPGEVRLLAAQTVDAAKAAYRGPDPPRTTCCSFISDGIRCGRTTPSSTGRRACTVPWMLWTCWAWNWPGRRHHTTRQPRQLPVQPSWQMMSLPAP
jgi:hypothetical protein